MSKYCGILTKLKYYLPLDILRTSYLSMMHSHLNYGLIAWGYDSNRLIKLQKRSIRTITRSKYNAHTSPLLRALDILSLPDMLLLNALKFYYKIVPNETPAYFFTFTITTQGSIHDHNTRHMDNIWTTRTRLNIADKCLRNYLPSKINSIPNNLLSRINTHSNQVYVCCKELSTKSIPDRLHWNELLCLSASLIPYYTCWSRGDAAVPGHIFAGDAGYSISQEICTRFLLCCALLWLYIDWFSHIHQAYFTGTVAI